MVQLQTISIKADSTSLEVPLLARRIYEFRSWREDRYKSHLGKCPLSPGFLFTMKTANKYWGSGREMSRRFWNVFTMLRVILFAFKPVRSANILQMFPCGLFWGHTFFSAFFPVLTLLFPKFRSPGQQILCSGVRSPCTPVSGHARNPTDLGTSLGVQWLRLHTPNPGGLGSIPDQGTRSHTPQLRLHMLQVRILSASTKMEDPVRHN